MLQKKIIEESPSLPREIAECVVMDVGNESERKGLLRVIQEDGVFRCHSKHHTVRQLEYVGKSLIRIICRGEIMEKLRYIQVKNKGT